MAKSSGHFGKGGVGYFAHNDRTSPTKNAIFSDEKNEVSLSAKEAFKIYRDELKIRSEAYYKRTNQKLQKNTATHRSLIINLNSNHKLEDLKPIKEYLEKQLDTKVLQIAIHRDEGHIDENGKAVKNYHAHFEMMGLDSLGFSLAQHQNTKNKTRADRLDSKFYTKFQDFLSQTLQMERGQKNSKTKRLDTYEYKHHAERTAEKVKEVKQELSYDFKEFQKKITSLETENTELKKQLHKLNSEIKNTKELELKNQKIEELEAKIKEQNAEYQKAVKFVGKHAEIELTSNFWTDFKNKMQNIAHNESEMALKLQEKQNTINYLDEEIDELCELTEAPSGFRDTYKNIFDWAKFKINQLKTTIKTLLQENSELKRENENLKKQLSSTPREETTDEALERCLREAEKLNIQPLTQEERDILNSLARQGDEIERESSRGFRL